MNKYAFLGLGLAFLGGVALGGGIGYKFTVSKLNDKYNEQMESEIARTRKFYERVNKTGDFESPASAAEALGVEKDAELKDAADALLSYQGKIIKTDVKLEDLVLDPFVEEDDTNTMLDIPEVEEHNVFDDASVRDPEKPYQISMMEFGMNEPEHDQVSITYYAGDKILADDQDKPVGDIHRCVGLDNLEKFGEDGAIVLVRNERLRTDYEISRSEGKYAHEVAGFQHSEENFAPIRRSRWSADE